MLVFFFFLVPLKWVGPAFDACADSNTKASVRVCRADPNRQKLDIIAVGLGQPVRVSSNIRDTTSFSFLVITGQTYVASKR